MPTFAPSFESEIAIFTATVDLPTPPLPEETAIMFFTPGIAMLFDLYIRHAVEGPHDLIRLGFHLLFYRASGRCKHDPEGNIAALDLQIFYKSERNNIFSQIGVVDLLEGFQYNFLC